MFRPSAFWSPRRHAKAPRKTPISNSLNRLDCAVVHVELLERRLLFSAAQFAPPVPTTIGTGLGVPFAVTSADVNGDGIPDIIVANSNGTLTILPGEGNGTFGTPVTFSDYLPSGAGTSQDLAVADGGREIFVTNTAAQGEMSILFGSGKGVFHLEHQPQVTENHASVDALTYTQFFPGISLLVTADSDGVIGLTSPFTFARTYNTTGYYAASADPLTSLAIGVVNGDGMPEVLARSSDGKIHQLAFPHEHLTVISPYAADTQAVAIAAANLTGGSYSGVIVANADGSIATLLGGPYGLTSEQVLPAGPASADIRLITGDIQGDGGDDALLLTYNGSGGEQVQPLLSNGTGHMITDGASFYAKGLITLADVNGDGKADIVSAYYNTADSTTGISVALNTGANPNRISSSDAAAFPTQVSDSFTINTRGFASPPVLSVSGNLPADLQFHDNGDGTATITGTPGSADVGTYTLTLEAGDGIDPPVTQTFTLSIYQSQAPTFTSPASTDFERGVPVSFTITSTASPTATITESGALPPGLMFHSNLNGTALLYGIIHPSASGLYDLSFTANNGDGPGDVQTISLTVVRPPTISSDNQTTFTAGQLQSFEFASNGFPVAALTETGALPQGVTFQDNGDGTATLTGTPDAGTGGVYDLTVTASNGLGDTVTQAFTLTIQEAPVISSTGTPTFTVGASGTFQFTTIGFPAPTITETGDLPDGLLFTTGSGTAAITGCPTDGQSGSYVITLSATNGIGQVFTQSFVLIVQDAPISPPDDSTTPPSGASGGSDGTVTTDPGANPPPADPGTNPPVVTPPPDDTTDPAPVDPPQMVIPPLQVVTPIMIDPTLNLWSGQIESPTIQIGDPLLAAGQAGGSAAASQTWPTITSSSTATFTHGVAAAFTVTTSSNSIVSLLASELPAGITFTNNGDGTATLSGAAAAPGSYSLLFTAGNSDGAQYMQQFLLIVV